MSGLERQTDRRLTRVRGIAEMCGDMSAIELQTGQPTDTAEKEVQSGNGYE